MYSYAKRHGGVKQARKPTTSAQKAKLMRARAPAAAQNRAVQSAQMRGAVMYRRVGVSENKFFDPWTANGTKEILTITSGAVSNSAGGFVLNTAAAPAAAVINQIAQGTSQLQRLGRRVQITGVHIRGRILQSTAGAVAVASLSLVHQLPPNNPTTMPPFTDLWVTQNQHSLRNVDNSDKLKIIRQLKFKLTGNSNTPATGEELHLLDEFIDLKSQGVVTEWTQANTSGTYADMEKGALMLYGLSDAAANAPSFFVSVRVYFQDY